MTFTRPVRRALLVAHVVVSVGWLGTTLTLLTLAIAGATARDPATVAAAYRAMRVVADWLLPVVSVSSLVSGVALALGTRWGLARHRWVVVKFWLTLAATAASALALRLVIGEAADAVTAGKPVGSTARTLLAAPSVALCLYTFLTAVSVLKPWGPTRRGHRRAPGGPASPAW
ncbi:MULTISPECIES: hypothetical protein [Streptomycetaceae]|uniref:hypothetical protein n=1 Tax=Streptomycetaceae TaxID=2062 RepID=UPI000213E126|nr:MULTISPECIES: hypothetical protein [Streptomycetaceae]MYS60086.1 DUF2269 domain-containing protein [Streptomyces sp. SID5468]CCB75872.1 Membrane protein [Streptantibioticus cattleyicolor NRRL 8057 = DSM 46488]